MEITEIDDKMKELDEKFHKLRALAQKVASEMDVLAEEYATLKIKKQNLENGRG